MIRELRGHGSKGALCIAFGSGLLIASCLPYTIAVILVAAVLVCVGLSLCRC